MKVLITADHPILMRIDKHFDVSNPKADNEINGFLADLEYMGYENIDVIE